MNLEGVHANIAGDPVSINTRIFKFIAYIHIRFNQNLEAVKLLHEVYCYQRNSVNDVMTLPTSNQFAENHGLF